MTTQRYDAAFRIGEGEALRWWRMAAIALASVLVWTVVLGLLLAPRWPELPSFATSARNQPPIALLATSIERAKDPQPETESAAATIGAQDSQPVPEPATATVRASDQRDTLPGASAVIATIQQPVALPTSLAKLLPPPTEIGRSSVLGSETLTDLGKPVTIRPKAYSSIDAQTLAAARARGEVLAGKRTPVVDHAPSAAASANDATAIPPVAGVEDVSHVGGSSDRPHSSSSRFDIAQPNALAPEPLAALPPRVASATRDSRIEFSQHSHARAVSPRVASPIRASPPSPTSRGELAQTLPSGRDMKRVVLSPRTPTSRVELAQTSPSGREAKRVAPISRAEVWQWQSPPRFDPPRAARLAPATGANGSQWPSPPRSDSPRAARFAPANGANRPVDRDISVTGGSTRAAPSSPRQDAAAARLDDVWERRERWLRERLHTR